MSRIACITSRLIIVDRLCLMGVLLILAGVLAGSTAHAADVPEASARYRLLVQRVAGEYFGLDASPARLAAQLHQESGWRPDARSAYAVGMAQFTPQTAAWLPSVCPGLGDFDPWDAAQAVRGAACYDRYLYERQTPMSVALDPCTRWVYTLRAYNGGAGWLLRERRAARAAGADPDDWQIVERYRLRARWAHQENTAYPHRILMVLEPMYLRAGWSGEMACQ